MNTQPASVAAIRQVALFAGLPAGEIQTLADVLRMVSCEAGSLLLREGLADDHFYILLEGEVEIIKALGTADERSLGVGAPGAFLGEMSLFSRDGTHTASVRTLTAASLLEMTRGELDALLHREPTLVYGLVRMLTGRLEQSEHATILDLREKNRQLTKAYEELQAAQAQLIEKERLERELQIAREMQLSILPHDLPRLPHWDLGALMEPARAVGGDFYDVIPLSRGRLGVLVGDVCGKGVSAALFGTLTYSMLRIEATRHASPGETLRAVNRHLLGVNSSGTFATLVYGILNLASGELSYARAGHPQPLVLAADGRPLNLPSSPGQMLGLLDEPLLDEQTVRIPTGGLALIFSDGFTEAADDSGLELGLERLAELAAGCLADRAQSLCLCVWQGVRHHCGEASQQDDLTLLAIKSVGA